jgi:hypothetical protein
MIEEEDISAQKRKNRHADNIMLNNPAANSDDDDESNQLVLNGQPTGKTPKKGKGGFGLDDGDSDEDDHFGKKRLLNESDFELNEKRTNNNSGTPGASGQSRKALLADDLFGAIDTDNSLASMETLDAFVGPVKTEFDDLKRKIDAKDKELAELEDNFYKRVSSKAVELEGIGPEQEAEIERHRHLFEMQQLMELNQRMSKIEREKIELLKQE